jgi:hypothetical protein
MFSRSLRVCALAVSPFPFCFLSGCVTSDAASPTEAGTVVGSPDAGSVSSDAPSQGADSGGGDSQAGADATGGADVVVSGDDSGIAQDDAPAGCPGPVGGGTVEPPVGRMLVAGNSLSARGMTSDGYEIYSDDAAFQLYAVPVAGGAPQSIAALGSSFWVTVVGQVVFAWSDVTAANVGVLTAWSSAAGSHAISSASFGILGTSSPAGTQILYVSNVDSQGATGDVYLSATDGTGVTRLLQGQQLAGCFPQLGFAGSYVLASHCDVPRGAGPSSTISSFKSPAWTQTDLVSDAENVWSADTAGTIVLVSTNAGIFIDPIGGGAAKMIDATGFLGQLIAGGTTAIYGTTSGALRRSSTTVPSPMTLAPTFAGFYAVSPDQDTVMYYENSASTGTDVYLASAVAPATPLTLSATMNGAVIGDAFTSDSTYALYSTSSDVCTGAATFDAFPVSGGASALLGQNVWGNWSATGATVIFNDNYVATGGLRFGRADLESVNLAAGTAVTRIVAQADAVIDLTPALDQVVYSWSVQPGSLAGLYVVPVP